MARAPGDRHYGLGDKTGPLDLTGRRLRCAMCDSLGFDPERGDPLNKNWPFLIVRDAASGVSHGVFYDNAAEGAFDFGCEHDNYFGRYRAYEAEDGDLDFYLILGPRLANVTAKFVALTGRTALPPRWSLGFAQTAMALGDAPDAQARIQGVIDAAKALDVPISSFHFGSGYTSIGRKRYVFTWNRAKFPEPKALTRAFADAGMKVVANVKPCLLDDHPRYGEVAAAGGFIAGGDDHAPLKSQFWDGEGAHVDFTHPAGVAEPVFPIRFAFRVVICPSAKDRLQLARRLAGLARVRFVHDYGVAALGDFGLPRPCQRLLRGGRRLLRFRARDVQQAAKDERELLQRSDHDLGAVDQCCRELFAVLIDRLDHPLGVLDPVDRVLKLGLAMSFRHAAHAASMIAS
jgi:hypothetical protein